MLRNHLYYALKPYLPPRLRLVMRRWHVRRLLPKVRDIWPINEAAGKKPDGWPGWPEGKQFAVVLTHDVEGQAGLDRVRQLAELEMKYGFRSIFNFIPEGEYRVSKELRDWLTDNGFEVGVHDLYHDGKLYRNRETFRRHAQKINRYLKEWNAVGFRSGFMHHNLDWLHDLDIQYDMSTFDTDPFEPQPDGVNTIFPFWVPRPEARDQQSEVRPPTSDLRPPTSGYIELPYTLPQDSSLFLFHEEYSNKLWIEKAEWISQRGGMVLLDLHPDYVGYGENGSGYFTYPSRHYEEFLQHLRRGYAGQYWHPLPRDLAAWYRRHSATASANSTFLAASQPHPQFDFSGRRVAVLLYSGYPSDPRPRREMEALIHCGAEVDLICLQEDADQPRHEQLPNLFVTRLPLRHQRAGRFRYLFQYGYFIFCSFLMLAWRSLKTRYDLVHVHNMPDVLVFSAMIPKLRGAKVILDLHDPMPELYRTIFKLDPDCLMVRCLKLAERWSIGFADMVFTVNKACQKIFGGRSGAPGKIHVIMNSPDENIFKQPSVVAAESADGIEVKPRIIMYHGSLVERHGLDLAIDALEIVKRKVPQAELRIYGRPTPYITRVMDSVGKRSLNGSVRYLGARSLPQIVEAIRECDVGIIPNRRNIFTELNTPTRIFEYLAMAKPVIAPRAPGIQDYFGEQDLLFFEFEDVDNLAKQMIRALEDKTAMRDLVRRGQAIYLAHSWQVERVKLLTHVSDLLRCDF